MTHRKKSDRETGCLVRILKLVFWLWVVARVIGCHTITLTEVGT